MSRRPPWSRPLVVAAVVSAVLGGAACSSASHSSASGGSTSLIPPATTGASAPSTAPPSGPTAFSAAGPYAAGTVELRLADGTPVTAWYPADPKEAAGKPHAVYDLRDALPPAVRAKAPSVSAPYTTDAVADLPAAAGRFPGVLFSHGFAGYRQQSSFLTAHLATWGFVVLAPEHPGRDLAAVLSGAVNPPGQPSDVDQLRAAVDLMGVQNAQADGRFAGRIDLNHVAAVGHSAGGAAAFGVGGADPRVKAVVGLAGSGGPNLAPFDKPTLIMAGTADRVVPLPVLEGSFARWRTPKRLVELFDAGHLAFADVCAVGQDRGGLVAAARAAGLVVPAALEPLAADGCTAPDLAPEKAWPVIDHVVTAQLRVALGVDASPVGLGENLSSAYDGVTVAAREG